MNKCCIKNKECEHATSYGVCKLSSNYDCNPVDETEYLEWLKNFKESEDKINVQ